MLFYRVCSFFLLASAAECYFEISMGTSGLRSGGSWWLTFLIDGLFYLFKMSDFLKLTIVKLIIMLSIL